MKNAKDGIQIALAYNNAMATVGEALALARQNHHAGRLQAAEQLYRQILAIAPHQPDVWHLLGILSCQQGKFTVAVESFERAIDLNASDSTFHNSLGIAYKELKKLDQAVAAWRKSLALKSDNAEALSNLGIVLYEQGSVDEAVSCWQKAIAINPNFARAYSNLGNALREQGKLEESVVCLRRAVEVQAANAEVYTLQGNAYKNQGKLEEAIACHQRALELKPDYAEAYNNLGNAIQIQGKLDEAIVCYRRAIELKPDFAEAHNNLGIAFKNQGNLDEALACYERALQHKPDYADARFNRAHIYLLTGDWQRGWPESESRWQSKNFTSRQFAQPIWAGESLAGKTILLHAEQGLGDTIQFIRYVPLVKLSGGTVLVECQKALLGLLEGFPGIDRLIAHKDELPPFDVHAPLLSLPRILNTTLQSIPATVPYLEPKPELLKHWLRKLDQLDGFKIGIAWQGNPTFRSDRFRSVPLRYFAPLAEVPGVRLISLQKGFGTEQLADNRELFPVIDLGLDLDHHSGPFMDTAALMKNLDLVITSDSVTPHLAGALGVQTWMATPFAPDWRWLLERSDSPWYPTMRLFRQKEPGNWDQVFEEIAKALSEWCAAKGEEC